MSTLDLISTRCAICSTLDNATELYPSSFRPGDLNPAIFSARRASDRVHYRMVRCTTCGLVRSDPIASPETLNALYQESAFDYDDEVANLRSTYGRYLARLFRLCSDRGAGPSLLEVGCGNGFALEEALARGFSHVRGVEPSMAAVASAAGAVRPHIVCDILRPGLFEPAQFDAVCLFQMFDHVPDPAALLDECLAVLKPGGHILILNHNVSAISARVLRGRSPIIDIEHTYLYSPATLARICTAHGFVVKSSGAVLNRTRVGYLARLAPLPPRLRKAALATGDKTGLGRITLPLPLGNLYLIAEKARVDSPST